MTGTWAHTQTPGRPLFVNMHLERMNDPFSFDVLSGDWSLLPFLCPVVGMSLLNGILFITLRSPVAVTLLLHCTEYQNARNLIEVMRGNEVAGTGHEHTKRQIHGLSLSVGQEKDMPLWEPVRNAKSECGHGDGAYSWSMLAASYITGNKDCFVTFFVSIC